MRLMMAATVLGMAKDQRLDYHRHRLGIGQLLADIDEIEILEIDAVDRDDAGPGNQLALYDIAHQFGDIGVKDQNQRLALIGMAFHRADQALGESANQRISGTKFPAYRQRHRSIGIVGIETLQRAARPRL